MIDEVDAHLREWVSGIFPAAQFLLEPPVQPVSKDSICLHLLEMLDKPMARGHERAPLQVSLRYLVTAWSKDAATAHRMLGQLLFAAMESGEFEAQVVPVPAETWRALGVSPRPSFFVQVPLRQARPEPKVKPVLKPLVVQGVGMGRLAGVVFGPGDQPVVDAFLELRTLQLFTRTDSGGRFVFPAVPLVPLEKQLTIRAKGREFSVKTEGPAPDAEPVVIRLDLVEG